MSRIFSEIAECSCISEEVDFSEAQEQLEEAIRSLQQINQEFHGEMSQNSTDEASRDSMLKSTLFSLQSVDNKLHDVISLIEDNPVDDQEIVSNFGMTVKADMAKKKLEDIKDKHQKLRNEWYSQDAHLNKIASQILEKDNELKQQSVFCTIQGLVLSRMLWKASESNEILDKIATHDEMVLELLKMLDGCLYGFTQTYRDEMPEPSADEYQYVLSLCGILSNIASIPDGRFLLMNHQPVCCDVLNQIITILPNISVPKGEGMKWIMLTVIYNITICKEGEEYARNNRVLLQNLRKCLQPPHSEKTKDLALKLIKNLNAEVPRQNCAEYSDALEEL